MVITLFAGSRISSDAGAVDSARRFGAMCAQRTHTLAFGGTGQGLMSIAAQAALETGGSVVGIYCDVLYGVEPPMTGLSRMESLPTLAARRSRLIDIADLIVALPGGVGTLDELFEAVALRSLGLLRAKIALLNVNGFFNATLDQMERQRRDGLMPRDADWLQACESPEDVFQLPQMG